MRHKVIVTYSWETDLDCTADELLTSIEDDVFLHIQDHEPTIAVRPIEDTIVSQKID